MDDFFPFLIFIVIVAVNGVKLLAEKANGKPAPNADEQPTPKKPNPLQEFLQDLAEKVEPRREAPEWLENIERPDYMQEMHDYEAGHPHRATPQRQQRAAATAPAPEILPPVTSQIEPLKKLTTAKIPSQSMSLAGMGNMRIAMPPLLRSASGNTPFKMANRAQAKQALIAQMVFSTPRAFETSFDNTIKH